MISLPRSRSRLLANEPLPEAPNRLGRWILLLIGLIIVHWIPLPWLLELASQEPFAARLHDELWLRLQAVYLWLWPHSLALWGVVLPVALFALIGWLSRWPPTLRPHLALLQWLLRHGRLRNEFFLTLSAKSKGGGVLTETVAFERRRALEDWDRCRGRRSGIVRRAIRLCLLDVSVSERDGTLRKMLPHLVQLVLRCRLDLDDSQVAETDRELRSRVVHFLPRSGLDRQFQNDLEILLDDRLEGPRSHPELVERLVLRQRAMNQRFRQQELERLEIYSDRRVRSRVARSRDSTSLGTPSEQRWWLDLIFLAAIRWNLAELALAALEGLRSKAFLDLRSDASRTEPARAGGGTALATAFDHRLCATLLERGDAFECEPMKALFESSSLLKAEDLQIEYERRYALKWASEVLL